MAVHVKVGGTWQRVAKVHVKAGGTWQNSQAAIRGSSTWIECHGVQTLSGGNITASATAGFKFGSNGNTYEGQNPSFSTQINSTTDYTRGQTSEIISDLEIRMTVNSGGPTFGDTPSTWLALTSDRTFYCSLVTATVSANMTMEIRNGSTTTASGTYIATATF